MFNKYIAVSALACAALLPLSAQAQTSNSADADVNITLVQPIAVSYNAGSGSLGSVLIPDTGSVGYMAFANSINGTASADTASGSPTILADPTTFDYTVTGGTGLGYSATATIADANANDGVSFAEAFFVCQNSSGTAQLNQKTLAQAYTGACAIQDGTTKLRVAPIVTVASTASAGSDTKVGTLTVAVAYE